MNENVKRAKLDQRRAPIHEALEKFRNMRVVPFDVPGHKRGRGNPELAAFLGQQCVGLDVNSMKPLDNLCHPVSVIREAEELAADAFGAAHAFLMVGGTTSSVQSMVLTACKRGDEIILPRNVHRSVLNALVLCGAVPVYVNPEVDHRLGISLGMKREQVAKAIREHPNAVAVLVNNPTYYGICSDLRAIVQMAHDAGMLCLADEAHGTHFYFGGGLPVSAMAAGADMAAVSMHKSGGSLTQSSLLLIGPNVHAGYVRQIINLTQTTSGSYLLMSSLDISRRNLALRGRKVFHQVADMAEYAREEINAVGGYYAFGKELCNGNSVFDFDTTKLSVHTLDIGLAGIEVYDILRDEYDIQIEFGDIGNILAYLSIGDRPQEVERLVSALAEIKRRYSTDGTGLLSQEYIDPEVAASPQEAFYAPKKSLPLRETEHKSGGSLTQSSLLLIGPNVHAGYVRQIINLTQTTSGSYLLMSSLDISRRNLALRGRKVFHQVADMAEYAREEINAVGGYYAFGKELCNGNSVFDFDTTKLSVHTLDIGLAGIEVYDILRDEYDIQIEFGDIGNILAYLSIGDRPQEVERLVSALAEIKRRYSTDGTGLLSQEYIDPEVAASPQEAFYAPKKSLPLRETEGMVCSEFVMCYPPGIPILAPGERITAEILDYIEYAKAKGCSMTGPEDPDILRLNVLA